MADDIDEELAWEEWMELSEEQAEAIWARLMKEHNDWVDSLTPAQWYRYRRHVALRALHEAREFLAKPHLHRIECADEMARKRIRSNRLRLVKLRIFRATGTYPGAA